MLVTDFEPTFFFLLEDIFKSFFVLDFYFLYESVNSLLKVIFSRIPDILDHRYKILMTKPNSLKKVGLLSYCLY